MKKFKYTGKLAHNSTVLVVKDGKAVQEDLRLAPGEEYSLNEKHPVINTLVSTGLLVESTDSKQNYSQTNSK